MMSWRKTELTRVASAYLRMAKKWSQVEGTSFPWLLQHAQSRADAALAVECRDDDTEIPEHQALFDEYRAVRALTENQYWKTYRIGSDPLAEDADQGKDATTTEKQ